MTAPIWESLPLAPLGAIGTAPVGAGTLVVLVGAWLLALFIARGSYRNTVPVLAASRRRLLVLLRATACTVLLLLLLEPALISRQTLEVDPTVLFLVDDSASMSIQDVGERSRFDDARVALNGLQRELAQRRPSSRAVVGSGSRRLRLGEFTANARPRGEGTDLRSLVVSAEQRHLDENLAAIVLLSDGRDTRGGGPGAVQTPVFAVVLGDTTGVPDLRLDRVRYPGLVRKGDRLEISAELVSESAAAGSTQVDLLRDGELIDRLEVSWNPGTERHRVRFEVAADSLGWQRWELRARELPDEVLGQNNSSQIAFEVQKDQLRVLHFASLPSWNVHFLRRFAQRDPRFDYWLATSQASGMRVASADSDFAWPLAAEELAEVDLFIAESLQDYVRMSAELPLKSLVEAGAGLWVFAAGGEGRSLPRVEGDVRELLPLRPKGRWRMTRGEYRALVSPEGRGHSLLPYDTDLADFEQRLAGLPPFEFSLGPAEPTPDATVLLWARSGPWSQPLFTVRPAGRGTVAFWTGTQFWTWSFWRLGPSDNEDVYTAFVDNLMSRMAESGDRQRLRLRLPARVLAVGSEATVRATVLDHQFRPDDGSEVWLEWADADSSHATERRQRLPMELDPDSPGGRRLALPSLPAGEYRFRARIESADGEAPLGTDWSVLSIDAYSIEYRNPNPDPAALRSLAEHSGGRLLEDASDPSWLDELDLSSDRRLELHRLDLWSSWWALVAIVGLLGVEWGLRRRWGLL